jgi:TRAP-type C4-dicarboxylate transport system substrate-binding protein
MEMNNALSRRLAGVATAVALAFIAAPASAQQVVMKLTTATINDGQHEWMKIYKERLEKAAGGKLKVDIFPAGQLGTIPRMIEGMQTGSIEAFVTPTDFYVGIDPRFMVFGAPGVYRDRAHAAATIQDPSVRDEMLKMGEARGLIGVNAFILGTPAYLSRKPIKTLDEFKGQKIRINASDIEREQMARVGATGIPMNLNEVLPALQTGAIDGSRSVPAIFVNFKYQDVAKVMTVTNEAYLVSIGMVSKVWFDKLPADLQKVIMDEGRAMVPAVQSFANGYEDQMYKRWTDAGGQVVNLSAGDRTELMKRMEGVGPKVVGDKPAVKAMYDRMVAAASRIK